MGKNTVIIQSGKPGFVMIIYKATAVQMARVKINSILNSVFKVTTHLFLLILVKMTRVWIQFLTGPGRMPFLTNVPREIFARKINSAFDSFSTVNPVGSLVEI